MVKLLWGDFMINILLVEDDKEISLMVKNYLTKEGYLVDTAYNGEEGIFQFRRKNYGLVILDIMMPKIDGIEMLKIIREKSNVPAIILSAKDTEVDKALGLGFGADDYIAKPFSMIELSARVKSIIRRATVYSKGDLKSEKIITIDNIVIDLNNYLVKKNNVDIKLTGKEFEILKLLVNNPNMVFTKEQIYNEVWQEEIIGDENIINVHIRRLREKLEENPSKPKYIKTLWGIGYKFQREEQ